MKKAAYLTLFCLLLAVCVPGQAQEPPTLTPVQMETDPGAFEAFLGAAGWQTPAGYTLEAFVRGDLSRDDHDDSAVASLLAADGQARLLTVYIGNPFDRHAFTSLTALPAGGAGTFLGFTAAPGFFTLHTGAESDRAAYTFGYHGERFYLDSVIHIRWDSVTMAATEQAFQLDTGSYVQARGRIADGLFTADSIQARHPFDADRAIITLEDFDIGAFPLDWDAFLAMLNGRAAPTARPTNQPTARPRPTQQPMPGPVYPTDMPGPIYPTDMPGPVYPTDMPGPLYPTPSPTPSEMPGPIDFDSEGGEA